MRLVVNGTLLSADSMVELLEEIQGRLFVEVRATTPNGKETLRRVDQVLHEAMVVSVDGQTSRGTQLSGTFVADWHRLDRPKGIRRPYTLHASFARYFPPVTTDVPRPLVKS